MSDARTILEDLIKILESSNMNCNELFIDNSFNIQIGNTTIGNVYLDEQGWFTFSHVYDHKSKPRRLAHVSDKNYVSLILEECATARLLATMNGKRLM